MFRRGIWWLPMLALAGLPAQERMATGTVTVLFRVPEYINLDYTDPLIVFGNLEPEQEGWIEAANAAGELDLAAILISSNFPYRVDFVFGGPLVNGEAVLPLELATRLRGRGEADGQSFDTGGDWSPAWAGWQPASGGGGGGSVLFEPGYRFGVQARGRLLRSGLADAPGEYVQQVPMHLTVSSR